jgi:DNA-binding transcriptional ArsR family regulator
MSGWYLNSSSGLHSEVTSYLPPKTLTPLIFCATIFNVKVEYSTMTQSHVDTSDILDTVFLALGHPVRRQILDRLVKGEATVSEIAQPFEMSLNAVSKHLKVLENAGLLSREVRGREHFCRINPQPLAEAQAWLSHYHAFWNERLAALQAHLMEDPETDEDA